MLLRLLLAAVLVIIVMHFVSLHLHTFSTTYSEHESHTSLKTKSLETKGKRTASPALESFNFTNHSLSKLKDDLLRLRQRLQYAEPSRTANDHMLSSQSTTTTTMPRHESKPVASKIPSVDSHSPATPIKATGPPPIRKKAVIFTMDCIPSYEQNSHSGGASGKFTI